MNHDPSKEELVLKTKIKKEPNWIYHIDKNGNLLRGKMGAIPKHSTELVAVLNIERKKGYLYFFKDDGNVYKIPADEYDSEITGEL